MTNGSIEPYIQYKITAEIQSRGVGFSCKHAVQNFFKHYNLSGRLTGFKADSNNFSGVIEFFHSETQDFNVATLLTYLESSGRLPFKSGAIKKLELTPIVHDGKTEKKAGSKTKKINGNEKELQKATRRIKSMTDQVSNLKQSLKDKEGVLESLLQEQKQEFRSPMDAIIDGYLQNVTPELNEIVKDYKKLIKQDDVEIFVNNRRKSRNMSYISYINEKYGTSFVNERELNDWEKKVKGVEPWDQTEEVKSLLKKREKVKKYDKEIKLAREMNLSDEMIAAMTNVMGDESLESINQQIKHIKKMHSNKLALFEGLQPSKEAYQTLKTIWEKSIERSEKKLYFPVLLNAKGVGDKVMFRLYYPGNCTFVSMTDILSSIKSDVKVQDQSMYGKGLIKATLFANDVELLKRTVTKTGEHIYRSLHEARIIRAFGLRPRVIYLHDFYQ